MISITSSQETAKATMKDALETMVVTEDTSVAAVTTSSIIPEPKIPPTLKRKLNIIDLLECPVCLESQRSGPIFTCINGHVVCTSCQPKMVACPICRISPITACRNLIAEKLLEETATSDHVFQCRLTSSGCSFQSSLPSLQQHEAICMYRMVACPSRHRGACTWTGPMHMLIKHIVKEKCVQIVKMDQESQTYISVIGNFNQDDLTVFGRATITHWKPVLLVSADHMRYFTYLVIYRTKKGEWVICLRGSVGKEALDKIRVKITIRNAPSVVCTDKNAKRPTWSFEGDIVSHEVTEGEIFESGMFLLLGDMQVKKLCVERTLFEYVIEIVDRAKDK